jgi:hypothetical protein
VKITLQAEQPSAGRHKFVKIPYFLSDGKGGTDDLFARLAMKAEQEEVWENG